MDKVSVQHPAYGRRFLTSLVDQTAQTEPTKPFAIFPSQNTFNSTLYTVTFNDLALAINRAAWWLEEHLGKAPESGATIAWIGPTDIRYAVLAFATNKVGYTLLLPSPRNSVAFHLHIFKTAGCTLLLRDEEYNFEAVIKENPEIKDVVFPSLYYFLSETHVQHYPYEESEAAFHKPWIVIHSSGSTGMPKCITWTHSSLASIDNQHWLHLGDHDVSQLESFEQGNAFIGFPLFHAAGLLLTLGYGMYYNHTVVLPPPGQFKALTVIDLLENIKIGTLALPPSILEEITAIPGGLEKLSQVNEIVYAGGPLSDARAVEISKYAKIFSHMGSSESSSFPLMAHDASDIGYFSFPSELKGLDFRDTGNGFYELVFVRDPETDQYHSTWETFPDLQEYSTKDLYSKHPTKAGLFKYEGRNDDVLVLSNGEKVVALPLETILRAGKGVAEALVIGHGRFEISALIELNESAKGLSREQVLDAIQPTIAAGNKIMPKFGKLSADRVIFTDSNKKMGRTPKGTVIRKATLALYEKEIDDLYKAAGVIDVAKYPLVNAADLEITISSLLEIFSQISDIQDLNKDTDLFVHGFDSLGVMNAVRKLKAIVEVEKAESARMIIPSLIYSNPTIGQLAEKLRALSSEGSGGTLEDAQRAQANEMFEKYAADLPIRRLRSPVPAASDLTVVLTGSTGSLGAYLIDSLVASPKVAHIYALNRSADGQMKQIQSNKIRNLTTDFKNKVTFLQASLSDKNLGLSAEDYESIRSSANIIIHNQWQVDFNLNLKSFEPHVAGVKNLINLSISSDLQPYIIFTSTVSTIGSYFKVNPDHKSVPEAVFQDVGVPMPMGYGLSKQVGERLLNLATERTGLRTATTRIGQVSGPSQRVGGVWNKQEWFPSLSVSSAYLKLLPEDLACVDWIPVDTLADVLMEIAIHDVGAASELSNQSAVYNLANSNWIPWSDMVPTLLKYLPEGTKTVPLSEWVQALKNSAAEDNVDTVKNPAIKLIDFYEGLASGNGEAGEWGKQLEIKNGAKNSSTMHDLTSIRHEWLASWLEGWGLTRRT